MSTISSISSIAPVQRAKVDEDVFFGSFPISCAPIDRLESSTPADNSVKSIAPKFSPRLKEPEISNSSYLHQVVQIEARMSELARDYCKATAADLELGQERLNHLREKRQDLIRLNKNAFEAKKSWGVWRTVAQYVASTTTLIVGASCFVSGIATTAGLFLIASAGLGLMNSVIRDTCGWETLTSYFTASKQMQEKIAKTIDLGIFGISVGLSLAGGIGAWKNGAFALASSSTRSHLATKAAQIFAFSGNAMAVVAQTGSSFAEHKWLHLHADLKPIETEKALLQERLKRGVADISTMTETAETFDRITSQSISCLTSI